MRKFLLLTLSSAMLAGGLYLILFDLLFGGLPSFRFMIGGSVLAVVGAYLLGQILLHPDLAPKPGRTSRCVARMSEAISGTFIMFPAYRCAHAGYSLTTPMNDVLPFRTMAYNNAWANHRLLTACARLTPKEFVAKQTGFFPSLRATLNHILIIDHFYVDAMEGGTLGPAAWADQEPCATVAALKQAQAAVDQRLLRVVEDLDSAGLQRIVSVHRGSSIQRERMDRLLLHLFQHQVHHRGQAHAMLSGTSVSPPQLDEFFSVGEAPLRAAEFAELGWTEERIWVGSGKEA